MNTQILGISGRKSSGKNTAVNFILGTHMVALGIVKDKFMITEKGELYISDVWGDTEYEGVFDVFRGTPAMESFLAEHLNSYIKVYSFADLLKQEVCMKILGLTYEQCYGTDEQKNTLTLLKWENMPGVVDRADILGVVLDRYTQPMQWIENAGGSLKKAGEELLNSLGIIYHTPGPMTAREVMQFVGSNLFRKMYGNVWVDSTIRRITDEGSQMALVVDCRFPNEVEGIQKADGKVIRLTRNPFNDQHQSETALDPENFNWKKFDHIIENEKMSIKEQNDETYKFLQKNNLLPIELDIN